MKLNLSLLGFLASGVLVVESAVASPVMIAVPVEAAHPELAYRDRYREPYRGQDFRRTRDFEERDRSKSRSFERVSGSESSSDRRISDRETSRRRRF
ncbi:hypothetical protein DSO57_1001300 [Entomophthora muscae]|uniref:Uncharacterized protein n=1 Tax=Entomophthora muscae TaxID=34485 RepID=A0ACC2U7S3_9FUNG|nr:hypothetical protein DSO57_1001300 [Entomophthora muscae]